MGRHFYPLRTMVTVFRPICQDLVKLVIDGKEYKLAQFHFHTPSEHQIHGQNYYYMEVHFVHQDANGNYAVLGYLIKEGIEIKVRTFVEGITKGKNGRGNSY